MHKILSLQFSRILLKFSEIKSVFFCQVTLSPTKPNVSGLPDDPNIGRAKHDQSPFSHFCTCKSNSVHSCGESKSRSSAACIVPCVLKLIIVVGTPFMWAVSLFLFLFETFHDSSQRWKFWNHSFSDDVTDLWMRREKYGSLNKGFRVRKNITFKKQYLMTMNHRVFHKKKHLFNEHGIYSKK